MKISGMSAATWLPFAIGALVLLLIAVSITTARLNAGETTTITIEEDGVERTIEVDPVIHRVIQGAVNRAYAAEDALAERQQQDRENVNALLERNRLRRETDTCGERVLELEMQLSRALAELDELEMRGGE